MKAINVGNNTYDIFDNTMQVYDKLPAQPYIVRCSQNRGFFLERFNNLEIKESKIYGVHESKVTKVLNMFESQNKNLGVILSGDKGIGKSLFAKMLSNAAIEKGIPLIIVDKYITGIASYIEDIEQEVMVLFDEFDKTFGEVTNEDGNAKSQTELLTLFDGISTGKKLFVITCNNIRSLSDYLINRPGRFHYHFRFDYPSQEEVREYLVDKLEEQYYGEIDNVISFSSRVKLNYDCLRAIATELNTGLSFAEAIQDLNIINTELSTYDISVRFKNGLTLYNNKINIDLFNHENKTISLYDCNSNWIVYMSFNTKNIVYNLKGHVNTINPQYITFEETNFDDTDSQLEDMWNIAKESGVDMICFNRSEDKRLHYII